jgi:hypothetical protein
MWKRLSSFRHSSMGFQTVTGIRLRVLEGYAIAFEVRYIAPDLAKPKEGGFAYSGDIGGWMAIPF